MAKQNILAKKLKFHCHSVYNRHNAVFYGVLTPVQALDALKLGARFETGFDYPKNWAEGQIKRLHELKKKGDCEPRNFYFIVDKDCPLAKLLQEISA